MTEAAGFAGELRRLDLLLHREVLRARAGHQLSLDELRGVYVSDARVDALLAELAGPDTPDAAALAREAEELRAGLDGSPLAVIAGYFGLAPLERDAILVAFAPELSLKYEALYQYLNNSAARRNATIDLILRLCGRELGDRAWLAASARLLRDGLLEPVGAPSQIELAREVAVAPALAAALLGQPVFDPRLIGFVEPAAERRAANVPLPDAIEAALDQLATALAKAAGSPIVSLVGDAAQAPESAALSLVRRWGRGLLRVCGGVVPSEPRAVVALALVARLRRDAVFIDLDEWPAETRRYVRSLVHALARTSVPVVVAAATAAESRAALRELPANVLTLDDPDVAARRTLWSRALATHVRAEPAPRALSDVAEHFRLGPAQIDEAARALAVAPHDEGLDDRGRLFRAARGQSSGELGHLAQLVPPRHAWSDVVLPAAVMQRLREVSGAIAARAKVFGDWGFGRRGGSGLMVLFAGSSGTGKTMSAAVIAREIGLELYRIELASVVSKYIGETEKNLAKIFEGARRANVMLFFDEADALLGRRSEVKDAHDRYANIEVAYLLQKMEEHDGVVILASNLAKNMDQAFARRMHYVVEFPRPDAPLRERLWRTILPRELPLADDIDFAFLARQFDLAGGDIKTTALDAAFAAAGEDRPLAMADLIAAIARQMLKQGRPPSASDFKHHHRDPRANSAVKDPP